METSTKQNTVTEKFLKLIESSFPTIVDGKEKDLAIKAFVNQGVPTRKHEEYKYVNVELILKDDLSVATNNIISQEQVEQFNFLVDAYLVVIVNGIFSEELSRLKDLPKGMIVCSLDVAKENHKVIFEKHYSKFADINADAFIALNSAMAKTGVFVHVSKSIIIEKPLHIIHISSAKKAEIINPRNLIVIEENAQAKIIESYETSDTSAKIFNNAVTEIVVGANSIVDHYKIQDENEFGYLLNTTQVVQKKQSLFSTHTFTLSGSLVRNNLTIVLDGEHIETHLNGLYLTNGNQIVDNHTVVDHCKPNCNSNELYKGIIDGKSSATFNGKIFVRKDAQKTNAFQSNKNILLSDDGSINTKPQLEIYADDVKCSHGTSTGKLDEDKIFYLRARGLSEISAKKLLMHAFASEVVNTIKIDALREYVEEKISKRFE
ncbi:MAG: Fe-S cluster assembly protein SufD [Bacteroidetes bacterium RIFCSPLOWO2_12_FULL_35_15]|nr:MAG: Fe-S cluster assembly protein SufD [Bacteroidetes bacterium RIFCSPLOWO2_12_FULL_35_15]